MIYFVQVNGGGPIKIGFTRHAPTRRMVKLQSDCPWQIILLGAIPGTVDDERKLHKEVAAFRTQGEWFEPTGAVLNLVNRCLARPDRWPLPEKKRRQAKYQHPICQYRHVNGLTLINLAEKIGVTKVTLSRWESGARKIRLDTVRRVSKVTGIPVRQLRPDIAKHFEAAE